MTTPKITPKQIRMERDRDHARICTATKKIAASIGSGEHLDLEWAVDLIVEELRKVEEENAALRRLSVIRTCGECRWCHPSEVCAHARAHIEQEIDGSDRTPPEWCPLRGAR